MGKVYNQFAWKGASFISDAMKAFFSSKGSADADLSGNRGTLEYRSRSLYQNSAFAGAAVNTKVVNVVGTGLKCRPQINYELLGIDREKAVKWERSTRTLFELWANSKFCDAERENTFAQMQDLALKTELICGDAFALRCFIPTRNSPFGTCFKILEGNRCQNPTGLSDCDAVTMGVEVDSNGAAVAYYFTEKPIYGLDTYSDYAATVRVPAFGVTESRNVIHVFETDRPNQRRGIPWLAPVIQQIKQQERYADAELIAAVVASMFTVFIKTTDSDLPDEMLGNVPDPARVEPPMAHSDGSVPAPKPAAELTPGGIVELGQHEEIQTADPKRPNANYDPFVNSIFNEIGARLGIAREVVLKKFDSSYNAVRAAILESKKTFDKARMNLSVDFCQPVYDAWLDECVQMGIIDCEGYEDPMKRMLWHGCRWIGDAPIMLDPLKETQALKMQLDEQLTTRSNACTQVNGGEYEAIATELAEESKIRARLDLPEPGSVNKSESVTTSTQEIADPQGSDK